MKHPPEDKPSVFFKLKNILTNAIIKKKLMISCSYPEQMIHNWLFIRISFNFNNVFANNMGLMICIPAFLNIIITINNVPNMLRCDCDGQTKGNKIYTQLDLLISDQREMW